MHKSRNYLFVFVLLTVFIATPAFAEIKNLFNVNAVILQQGDGFKAHLIGPGLTWDLPPFAYLETNLYYRDNPDLSGGTWQFTAAWVMLFELDPLGFLFDGYTDIRGSEGEAGPDLNFNPQLKLDVGRLFGYEEMIYAGFEYYHWNNKFGIDGVNERLLSPIVQARISF